MCKFLHNIPTKLTQYSIYTPFVFDDRAGIGGGGTLNGLVLVIYKEEKDIAMIKKGKVSVIYELRTKTHA